MVQAIKLNLNNVTCGLKNPPKTFSGDFSASVVANGLYSDATLTPSPQSSPLKGEGACCNSYPVCCTMLPEGERNYALFNKDKVEFIASQKEHAIPYVKQVLETSQDENEIVEALYITDRLCDNGTKGVAKLYPTLAKFNDTKSANIQTFLAGIYRKTQVPDAFGPLVKMLVQNSLNPAKTPADEEIGGAILEYIRNYSNNPKKIDYSA